MNIFDYISTSIKNLTRRKLRTFLTVSAIVIGSLAVILLVSVASGIKSSINDMFKSMDAFTLITVVGDPDADMGGGGFLSSGHDTPTDEAKKLTDEKLAAVKKIDHVYDATAIGGNIWVNNMQLKGESKKTWPNLIAYDPDSKVYQLPLIAGRKLKSDDMDKILISTRIAKLYGFEDNPEQLLGKKIVLTRSGGSTPDWGALPEKPPRNPDKDYWEKQNEKTIEIEAEIVGIAQSSGFDDSQNYITLAWAKKLMTDVRWEFPECGHGENCGNEFVLSKTDNFTKNGYGSFIIKVDDMKNLPAVADKLEALGYGVATAEDAIAEINEVITGVGIVLGAIGGIALFVAAIGIINTMVMATFERTREIGVMRACGATRATIRRLFTFESSLLGFWGGVFGLILSYGIAKLANYIVSNYVSDMNLPIDNIASFPWWLVAGVITFTTLIGLIAGLGPAIKAAKLNPVDALRYE